MQVNSVSYNSVQSFGQHKPTQREYLEGFAALDDKDLRKIAYAKASNEVNDKKHRRISNAIFYSIPLAAGLAAAVRTPSVLGKAANRLRGAKLVNFATTALNWAGTFAVLDLVFGGKRVLERHSESARNFAKEHPILSTIGTIGAGIGLLFAGGKGVSKLADKALSKVRVKDLKNVIKANNKLNNSKILNSISAKLAKVPSSIKGFAKGLIEYGPVLLFVSHVTHSINHSNVRTRQTYKNYEELKDAQNQIKEVLGKADEAPEADDID